MGSNNTSHTSEDARIVLSKYFSKASVSTPEKSTESDSNEANVEEQRPESERWSERRINHELLREGPNSASLIAKDGSHNEEAPGASNTRSQKVAGTVSKSSSLQTLGPAAFTIREPSTVTKTSLVSDVISRARRDAETSLSTPGGSFSTFQVSSLGEISESRRRRASSPLSGPPPSKKVRETSSDDHTRGRMASLGTKAKPRDYSRAAEKPSGLVKAENDSCLTCIHYGRKCKGTELVRVDVKGDEQIKCALCNKTTGHGGRRCYWKDLSRSINTYEEARKAHNGITNNKNTRAGRVERAKQNPNSRLALDANRTYVPPTAQEGSASSSYERLQLKSEQPEDRNPFQASPFVTPTGYPTKLSSLSVTMSSCPALSDHDDYNESEGIIDDDDIKTAFKDAMNEVTSVLQAALGNQWSKKMLWASMLVHVRKLSAREDIIEGMEVKLISLVQGAMAQDWLGDDD